MTTIPAALAALDVDGSRCTAREIAAQPRVWRDLGVLIEAARPRLDATIAPLLRRDEVRVVLTGAGTSAHIGETLAPAASRRLGRPIEAIATTDLVSAPLSAFAGNRPTLLVSFARSGGSPESLAATRLADQCLSEVHHLVITCDPAGALHIEHSDAERSTVLLMPSQANDRGFAMTSSYTSMLLAGWLALTGGSATAVTQRAAAAAESLLASRTDAVRSLALGGPGRVVYLGSGALRGAARESALKMLELTAGRVTPTYDTPMGFRHGPKAILDAATLVVVLLSGDPYTRTYDQDVVSELRADLSPGQVLVLGSAPGATPSDWDVPGLDGMDDAVLAAVAVLVPQMLALFSSVAQGCTPDNPFPSGRVNRVVRGVTIHPLAS